MLVIEHKAPLTFDPRVVTSWRHSDNFLWTQVICTRWLSLGFKAQMKPKLLTLHYICIFEALKAFMCWYHCQEVETKYYKNRLHWDQITTKIMWTISWLKSFFRSWNNSTLYILSPRLVWTIKLIVWRQKKKIRFKINFRPFH